MSDLQKILFEQLENKDLFEQAKKAAFEYLKIKDQNAIVPGLDAIQLLSEFDEPLPDNVGDPVELLEQLSRIGNQTVVNQNTGRYFGFVNGGALPVAIAAKWLADMWDQNAALQVMSPLSAKIESLCQQWLIELFSLPSNSVAGLVGGTSIATLCGLAAARYRQLQKLQWDVNQDGLFGAPKLRFILGSQTHGTVVKALKLLGVGNNAIEWVACDDQGKMIVEQLPQLDGSCVLVLQAGNVNTGAFDDFPLICSHANKAGAWVHVDGAFGLWAAGSAKFTSLTKGMEKANSWSVDAHKTLNTPYDCGIILCADPEALTHALHQQGSYIQYGDSRDNMIYTLDMSRRARGIELWASLKFLGKTGIGSLLETLHHHALQFSHSLRKANFTVLNDVVFNQVLVRCESDSVTLSTLRNIQQSGICWCGGSEWQNRPAIRISICSWATTSEDIRRSVDVFINARKAN